MTEPPVPADLSRLVAGSWILAGAAVPRTLPQPAVDLVVMPDGRCRLAGPETHRRQGPLPQGGALVGVRLRPGTVTGLFGVAADEVPLAGAPIGAGRLPGTAQARLAGALALVRARAGQCRVDEQVRRVLAFMHAAPGAPVARHAAEAGLSERQLRRRFVVAVGLRPKAYIRVVRLHAALAAARAGLARGEPPQWAATSRSAVASTTSPTCSPSSGRRSACPRTHCCAMSVLSNRRGARADTLAP